MIPLRLALLSDSETKRIKLAKTFNYWLYSRLRLYRYSLKSTIRPQTVNRQPSLKESRTASVQVPIDQSIANLPLLAIIKWWKKETYKTAMLIRIKKNSGVYTGSCFADMFSVMKSYFFISMLGHAYLFRSNTAYKSEIIT